MQFSSTLALAKVFQINKKLAICRLYFWANDNIKELPI